MATPKIVVTPGKLDEVGDELNRLAAVYQQHYTKLFSTTDGTKANWNGDDNTAFATQIKRYQDDFQSMTNALKSYAQHLKTSATSYRNTEKALAAEAKTKSSGLGK